MCCASGVPMNYEDLCIYLSIYIHKDKHALVIDAQYVYVGLSWRAFSGVVLREVLF